MSGKKNRRRALFSWLFVSALLVLCALLGILQYRWIGEVTVAARERLRGGLQASLNRFSREFNSEISTAAWTLVPSDTSSVQSVETAVPRNYEAWKGSARHSAMFSRIAIAEPRDAGVALQMLDLNAGAWQPADWPAAWTALKDHLESRAAGGGPRPRRGPPDASSEIATAFEIPLFGSPPSDHPLRFSRPPGEPRDGRERLDHPRPGRPPESFGRREVAWLILELNVSYVRDAVLPELLQRDLADYQVEVLTRTYQPSVIFQSEPGDAQRISASADGSVSLFTPPNDFRGPGRGPGGPNVGPPQGPQQGRWEMYVRHRAGSLETVVAGLRRRDLAVTGGVLILLLASVAALVRYTGSAQRLAQLQMDFVAGISHELRTPLTVIHTAGYNLRGKMAHNPSQVERYGALIQQESARLTELVEQIMRFAGTEAGRVIREPEPLSIETVIHDTVESSRTAMEQAHCVLEESIDAGLPLILGDPTALRHALQNLLTNAAKYGTKGSNWIGVFASKGYERGRTMVEIRVADRGPGIPREEQKHIFDPFFRGQRAVEDQVHGTGLGLNLVKRIVEAHGGTIQVRSEPMKGAEFIVRIPEAAGGVAG